MKKRLAGWLGGLALLALATGCFRNTISEIELDLPAMRTPACAAAVEGALAKLGIGSNSVIRTVRLDVEARKAWVTYDNVRLGRRNIEVAVRHAGFAVNDLPADEAARAQLAPECRGNE